MKQIAILLVGIVLIVSFTTEQDTIKIPEQSIRFRIIANSNSPEDQKNKMLIAKELQDTLFPNIEKANSIEESRKRIEENIPAMNAILTKYGQEYQIDFGNNYFPIKEYKGVIYDAGIYESLVISLGEAKGDNFWCVLFPPLCLLEAHDNNTEDVEYRSLVKDILNNM